jgi:hypothetical protein
MTKISEQLQKAREGYLCFLREKLNELRLEQSSSAAEVLVRPNNAPNPEPFSLMRVDALFGTPPDVNAVRYELPVTKTVEFTRCQFSGVGVSIGAFSWENATFAFRESSFQLLGLKNWLSHWIDDQELRRPDHLGLSGVVHSIAWQSSNEGDWQITIDFGSSPVTSALNFIEVLNFLGVAECSLSTHEQSD